MRRLTDLLPSTKHKTTTKPTSEAVDNRAHCPFHQNVGRKHRQPTQTDTHATAKNKQHTDHPRHQHKRSRHPILKTVLGLAAFGIGASVATTAAVVGGTVAGVKYVKHQMHRRRAPLRDFRGLEATNLYRGRVHRDAQTFTLTTTSKTYAIDDPMAVIDRLAQQQGIRTAFYDFDARVLARVSRKGKYGYLGHLDYELTVVGLPEGDIQLVR